MRTLWHPIYEAQLRNLTTEASVLSSKRVATAIAKYLERVHHVDISRTMNQAALFDHVTTSERLEVINAMRKDLGTSKLPRHLMAQPSAEPEA